ncbi:heparinase II/III domain-containing protein [Spirosoma validum]|uniref:Heparinase II/III family protein n=1 Tax=Spirosoma validum TaxID=2771355 RepID=A0A927B7B0_9BACT|nr:heparinase II/III family protein [Spirosoma validum]MBD2756780.1 heparinase II/III family protein [Spirosoma validum]
MKTVFALVLTIFIGLSAFAQNQNLLSGKFSNDALKKVLIPQAQWTPFPKRDDRAGWAKADPEMMKAYVKKAESFLTYQWPGVPATKSLLIERTGDRDQYQAVSFQKREVLGTLLLGEIAENKGRFIDQIIDGVWSICEESFWGASAHLPKGKAYMGLVDVSQPFVDLFAAETATYLAWVDYYVGDKLDAVSPQVRKRIYNETNYRVFQPLMTKPHGWMTKNSNGRPPNNWNPWIGSNWLNAILLLEKDDDKRAASVAKLLSVLDEFLNPYPQDGGCDEGPSYWGAAAASLYDNIAMLNTASNNAFQYVYADEKFRNMGRFIYRAQISEKYFLNFADADPQPGMAATMIYRYGKAINDPDMMKFGAFYRKPEDGSIGRFHYFRNFYSLFMQEEFQKAPQGLPLPKNVWLPDLQVFAARDQAGTTKGFYVAAKGGHNDESHNHNDVGNYVVYYDGQPLLIDVGRGTYTAKTFSSKRYDIWYNCSDYHNLPTINGQNQPPGMTYKASNVSYKADDAATQFAVDIAQAYSKEAGVKNWQRTVRLNRGKSVQISDVFNLQSANTLTQHLMTCYPAEVGNPGELIIHYKPATGEAHDFVVQYNPKQLQPVVEKVKLENAEDKGIITKWGDTIYRINFTTLTPKMSDKQSFTIMRK